MNPTTNPYRAEAARADLLAWAAETGALLPHPVELIVYLEERGHTVDLETGRVALWGAVRAPGEAVPLPPPVALAVLNLVEALELKHADPTHHNGRCPMTRFNDYNEARRWVEYYLLTPYTPAELVAPGGPYYGMDALEAARDILATFEDAPAEVRIGAATYTTAELVARVLEDARQ